MRKVFKAKSLALLLTLSVLTAGPLVTDAAAQTRLKPGMNLFSVRDDVEIGRRSATQIERQHRTHSDSRVTRIGRRFFFSSRRRHTSWNCDWSSDVCSSD